MDRRELYGELLVIETLNLHRLDEELEEMRAMYTDDIRINILAGAIATTKVRINLLEKLVLERLQ